MTEPSTADVLASLKSLAAEMTTMKADMAALKEKSASSSDSGGRLEGTRDLDRPPKFQKLDFPRYDGKSDPMLFLNKCDSYFRQQRTMPEERVWMASYHLEDVAQLWYVQLQEDEGTPTWGHFKDLLNLRFGPPLRSAPLFELAECRRTGTVEEYSNRFQALLPRAGRLDEAQRVQLFTGGLLPPLSHAVRIHNPALLAAAMSLERQVELMEADRLALPPPRAPARGLLPAPAPRAALPPPPQQLALPAPPAAAQPGRGDGNPRRLTPDEMAEWRRLGLCFNCNEKYSRGHNRFCRRIFFLDDVEIDDAGDDAGAAEPENEAPCFSLQAVAGVPMAGTMQLRVALGAAALVALLDSGSTHNFISAEVARRSGLPLRHRPRLTALVVNGERVTCEGVIRDAPLLIDGEAFPADLFVMPLAGYDVVLGTRWLGALGPIVWDLGSQRMSFQRHGRPISWTGVACPAVPALRATSEAGPLLDALLHAFGGALRRPRRSAPQTCARPSHHPEAGRPTRRRPTLPVPHGTQRRAGTPVRCHD